MIRRTFLAGAPCLAAFPALCRAAAEPFEAYEQASGGRIGVYARNLATGRAMAWRADARFVMCSTFKASLAGLVLARADAGRDDLQALVPYGAGDLQPYAPVARAHLARGELSVEALCAGAVELSDNTCANLLLKRVGGPGAVTRFWRSMGDPVSRLDHDEPLLNRTPPGAPQDTTTPAAMAGALRELAFGNTLVPASRERLIGWMLNCRTGADRLRAGLPASWKIADKTGNNGFDAAGDIAIAWPNAASPIVICVYTRGGSPTPEQLTRAFAEIGRAVGERLS